MNASRFSQEVQGALDSPSSGDLATTHADPGLTFTREGRRDLSRARLTAEVTLVIASALAETRRRWAQRLQDGLTVCEVTERRALERVVMSLKPDVLILDLDLPGLRRVRGLRVVQRLSPSTKILVMCESPIDSEGVYVLKAGARGYCERTIDPEQLKRAVVAIRQGEIWAPRTLVPGLVAELLSLIGRRKPLRLRQTPDTSLEALTERQRMVAALIGRGASNKEIANRLSISERTVKAHLTGAFRNVGVSDRLQLALLIQGRSPGSP